MVIFDGLRSNRRGYRFALLRIPLLPHGHDTQILVAKRTRHTGPNIVPKYAPQKYQEGQGLPFGLEALSRLTLRGRHRILQGRLPD